MIAIDLDAASLSRIRLAMSPIFELASWLSLTAAGRSHPILGDLGAVGRDALGHPDVRMLAEIVGGYPAYLPDFLTPKPAAGRAAAVLTDQLDAVAETPLAVVTDNLDMAVHAGVLLSRETRLAVDDGTFAGRAANGLAEFWRALAPRWPYLREVLERDLAERGRLLADAGIARVLRTLTTSVKWDGVRLGIGSSYQTVHQLDGEELVLAPSVLGWPRVFTQIEDRGNAVIFYPASHVGAPGLARPTSRGQALDELLGESRAAVLRDLDLPRTIAELSSRRALAPATVSYHVTVLLNAGLVLRKREGRRVLYSRSSYGDVLLESVYGTAG